METLVLKATQLDQAADFLKKGELVAFPTETVYGLGADATNEAAVKKVYAAKGRPSDNPLIVTVSSVSMVEQFVQPLSDEARHLIQKFWPGSLTMIFKLKPNALSKTVTGGLDTAAFRFPNNQTTLDLISKAGYQLSDHRPTPLASQVPQPPSMFTMTLMAKLRRSLMTGRQRLALSRLFWICQLTHLQFYDPVRSLKKTSRQ